ncbi:MAG: methyltransferase domain-containing protein [Alphaproteobacteria bacterium]|nr:MAG: methyltransferase domain-containing protein [Alphaproteobacteria bacterium]
MKRTTIIGITNESFVHPDGVKEELVTRRKAAEQALLSASRTFVHVDCPACGSSRCVAAFERDGYSFQSCLDCESLYMSPRPDAAKLADYYDRSDYAAFLRSDAYRDATADFRRDQARKRADKLIVLQQKTQDAGAALALYAPKSEMLAEVLTQDGVTGIDTLEAPWRTREKLHAVGGYALISAFDIFERVPDVGAELARLAGMLAVGGRIILSVRSGSGYDLLTLWQHADICPVEHMNLMTVEGISKLMEGAGFEVSELSTPGQLDLQIVERVRAGKSLKLDRFTEYFLSRRDSFAHEEFQHFLQKSLLSSHMLVVGVKK